MSTPPGLPSKDLKRSKYRLLGLVGQGQFGRVYCAVHRRTGQLVALKDLDHERFPTHKFLRELRFLLSLEHPNIVTCRALEHTPKGRYLVMDYCEGGTLRGLMEEDVRLSLYQCVKLTADILAALEHAHSRGIVHCDIKPENILLNVAPHGWTARVSDFGIARLTQELTADPHSGTGNTGSPAYMAPERFYGQYSKTSDLYSVGIMLYELLAGDRPFTGTPADLMAAHLNRLLEFPDAIPAPWHTVINTALQKLSARRYHTAGEMLQALKQVAEAEGILGYIERQPVSLPLLTSTVELPLTDFNRLRTERIGEPMQAIALLPDPRRTLVKPYPEQVRFFYCNDQHRVLFACCETALHLSPAAAHHPHQPIAVPEPVRWLASYPTGCYALGAHTLYRLSGTAPDAMQVKAILSVGSGAIAAITPAGQWGAVAARAADPAHWVLRLQPLLGSVTAASVCRQVSRPLPAPEAHLFHLAALDERHFVALFRSQATAPPPAPSYIEVLTRRGTWLGTFTLPVQIEQFQPTPFRHRFLATDACDPTSLVIIDLKPYRVIRFALNVRPHLLAAAPWGYVAADARGQVEILDEFGQLVGRLELPFPPTALMPFEPYGLLIATWNETWGHLHVVNLKTLEIQLLF